MVEEWMVMRTTYIYVFGLEVWLIFLRYNFLKIQITLYKNKNKNIFM